MFKDTDALIDLARVVPPGGRTRIQCSPPGTEMHAGSRPGTAAHRHDGIRVTRTDHDPGLRNLASNGRGRWSPSRWADCVRGVGAIWMPRVGRLGQGCVDIPSRCAPRPSRRTRRVSRGVDLSVRHFKPSIQLGGPGYPREVSAAATEPADPGDPGDPGDRVRRCLSGAGAGRSHQHLHSPALTPFVGRSSPVRWPR